jgi:hypothetical protein
MNLKLDRHAKLDNPRQFEDLLASTITLDRFKNSHAFIDG